MVPIDNADNYEMNNENVYSYYDHNTYYYFNLVKEKGTIHFDSLKDFFWVE